MTNQSTTSKEPERDSDRLRLHTPTTPSAAPSSTSTKNEILELSSKQQQQQRLDNELCSPSPPSRVPSSPGSSLTSIYQKKHSSNASASATTTSITGNSSHHIDSIIKEEPTFNDHRTHHQHRSEESMEDDDEEVGKCSEREKKIFSLDIIPLLFRSQYDSQCHALAKFDAIACKFISRYTIISLCSKFTRKLWEFWNATKSIRWFTRSVGYWTYATCTTGKIKLIISYILFKYILSISL